MSVHVHHITSLHEIFPDIIYCIVSTVNLQNKMYYYYMQMHIGVTTFLLLIWDQICPEMYSEPANKGYSNRSG